MIMKRSGKNKNKNHNLKFSVDFINFVSKQKFKNGKQRGILFFKI